MALGALQLHRFASSLRRRSVPLLPAALSGVIRLLYRAHLSDESEFGPGAELGYGGVGVVVEGRARIGEGAFLCQNVTLEPNVTLGREVLVGAGAVIRAGVTVGDHAQVGANAVVESDVAPGTRVGGVPAKTL